MWNSTEIINIVVSIGILITAIGAVIVNIIVAMKTGKKVDDSLKNQEAMSHQIAEVHTLTNSNLSAVKAELNKALMQIEEMRTFVRDLVGERDKAAHLIALNTPVPSSTKSSEVLDSIDKNTEITADNTAVLINKKEKK